MIIEELVKEKEEEKQEIEVPREDLEQKQLEKLYTKGDIIVALAGVGITIVLFLLMMFLGTSLPTGWRIYF